MRSRWLMMAAGAGLALTASAAPSPGPAQAASAAPAARAAQDSVDINAARAEGGTRSMFVNITYTCTGPRPGLVVGARFSWGLVGFSTSTATGPGTGSQYLTCDGKPHSTDIKLSTRSQNGEKPQVINKGESARIKIAIGQMEPKHGYPDRYKFNKTAAAEKRLTLT
ncbi:hypothetical protein ACSNOI_37005 [Actinomadura kijaniata]|uniref:hypothetical protein n=1 Tax=Actinomadura kijaniata TaxID=46161 RepID=UPI003F1D04B6